ncbi:hypothetical protein HQ531_07965 [bacterium]|nr:hypothetical protein [bacterium]
MAEELYGNGAATMLRHRLADIDSARYMNDILVLSSGEVNNRLGTQVEYELGDGYYLYIGNNSNLRSKDKDDCTNWSIVNKVIVINIGSRYA